MNLDFTLTLDLGILGEHDVAFSVRYIPATRDVYYLSNGDPGYPGDPAELEILSAKVIPSPRAAGIDITPMLPESDDLYDQLCDQAAELAYEDHA